MARILAWIFYRLTAYRRRRLLTILASSLDETELTRGILAILDHRSQQLPPGEALRLLFTLDNRLYALQNREAVRHGAGVHPKHRLTAYHDFFIQRIGPGERVLDMGCGVGALAHDLAVGSGAIVTGIDLVPERIREAQERFAHPQVVYHVADGRSAADLGSFDVVVLSNILEHLVDRPDFLRRIRAHHHPQRLLIRVPSRQRGWQIPMQAELGCDWRLDSDHQIEYTEAEFHQEMTTGGWIITEQITRWGEIWATCHPADREADFSLVTPIIPAP